MGFAGYGIELEVQLEAGSGAKPNAGVWVYSGEGKELAAPLFEMSNVAGVNTGSWARAGYGLELAIEELVNGSGAKPNAGVYVRSGLAEELEISGRPRHLDDDSVEIVIGRQIDVNFIAVPLRGRSPLEVKFFNYSSFASGLGRRIDELSFTWYFGDGFASREFAPRHTYFMPGLYSVRLSVKFGGVVYNRVRYQYIRVTDWDDIGGGFNVSRTNRCVRFGANPDTHVGFMEITGAGWPMPEARVGAVLMYDDNEQLHGLVLDANDGLWYNVTPRTGPAGTGMSKLFKDKVALDGTGGSDYKPSVKFGADRGNMEYLFISPAENHFYLRPAVPGNAGEEGYDEKGYPDDLAMTAEFYADEDRSTVQATAKDIKMPKHEVRFDRDVSGNLVETVLEFNKGEVTLIGREQHFIAVDRAASPDDVTMNEDDYQAALADASVWISRGTGLVNRATLATLTGAATPAEGPDGESDSALTITEEVTLGNAAVAAGTLLLWHKSGYTVSGVTLTQVGVSGVWICSHASGALPAALALPAGDVFDVRILDQAALAASALTYYYNNIATKNGDRVLP